MSSLCYINKDFEAEVRRARKAIDNLKEVIEVLKYEVDNRLANDEDVDTEELDSYEDAMKNLVWREFAANDFLNKERSDKPQEDCYSRDKEQAEQNQVEEVEKRIMQLEILNAEIEVHHARFCSGEAGKNETSLLTNRALIIQTEMKNIDNRISKLLEDILYEDPRKAEFIKRYENFWAAYRHKLKLEVCQ